MNRGRKQRVARDLRNAIGDSPRPVWRGGALHYLDQVVKHLGRSAPVQECLFAAFQRVHWTQRIPNPLPANGKRTAYAALRNNLKNLNRGLRLICFGCAGKGKFVTWRPR